MNDDRRRRIPLFVKTIAGSVVVMLAFALGTALYIANAQSVEERRDCERSVSYRDDTRAMWQYLLDQNPDPESPEAVAFTKVFEERLPQLHCVDGNPVPIEGPSNDES